LVSELMTRFWSCWANGSIEEGPATKTQRGRMWSFFIAAEIQDYAIMALLLNNACCKNPFWK
jgi:hypothetical protein